MIPNKMTAGKHGVMLMLGPPGSEAASQGVYKAYTHTDSYLMVESEPQGKPPLPAPVVKSNVSQYDFLRQDIDDEVSLDEVANVCMRMG